MTPELAAKSDENSQIASSSDGELTWEIARLFPAQDSWTEAEYLALETNQLVEFVDGRLEFLPTPTLLHQFLARYLFRRLDGLVVSSGVDGEVYFAPLRVRTVEGRIREPDIVFLRPENVIGTSAPPVGAGLAIEITSPGERNRNRDYEEKREEYAAARVPEYWIVDPEMQRITILVLESDSYRIHCEASGDSVATSSVIEDFAVDVAEMFAAARGANVVPEDPDE